MFTDENQTLCGLAFSHLFLSPQGQVKPCCRFKSSKPVPFTDLNSVFQGAEWNDLRSRMLKGEKVDGCRRCYEEEAAGKKSLRMRYNSHPTLGLKQQDLKKPKILWLEIAFSNRCNAACRMCDSRYSTRWIKDETALYGRTKADNKLFELDLDQLTGIAPHLRHIKMTGGEPLLDRNHPRFLEMMISQSDPSKIYLNYSTNLTIFPDEEIIEAWKKFERVELALSLDSIYPQETEYIRYPSDGKLVLENAMKFIALLKVLPNLKLICRTTVNIFNVHSLPETLMWWNEQRDVSFDPQRMTANPTHVTYPEHLQLTFMRPQQKKRISEKFEAFRKKNLDFLTPTLDYIESYMNSADHSHLYDRFLKATTELDGIRNQDFKTTFPHLTPDQAKPTP